MAFSYENTMEIEWEGYGNKAEIEWEGYGHEKIKNELKYVLKNICKYDERHAKHMVIEVK
jgi:hypothetical protein